MKRVLVCGSRHEVEWSHRVAETLDGLMEEDGVRAIITGGAPGIDQFAVEWADLRGVPCMKFPAAWRRHGRMAGPIRNQWMIDLGRPDLVVAFPGGRGTWNMVDQALKAGIEVRKVEVDP